MPRPLSARGQQRSPTMSFLPKRSRLPMGRGFRPVSRPEVAGPFLVTLWFGLVAGWLDLGLVLAQRAVDPHVSASLLRTNLHFAWMIPVSEALIFGLVGLSL